MAGKIYRRKKSSEFVTLDTHCSRNKKLRWASKGLHTYLFQLPEDWKINIADLENRSEDGRDATTSAMNGLILAGYVVRERKHDEKGRFEGYDYFVFERPEHAIDWITENGKPVNGSPVNGKTATSKVLKPLSEVSKNEGEGERTPPAPNPSNLQSQKKENGFVAPGDAANWFGFEAEMPPLPKVAPKGIPPAEDEDAFEEWLPALEKAWANNAPGAMPQPHAPQFEVTAIASPTDIPGVTLVEAANQYPKLSETDIERMKAKNAEHTKELIQGNWQKPEPLPRVTTTLEAESKISEWITGDGLETVKHRYNTAKQRFAPENAAAIAAHYCSVYTKNQANKERLLKDPVTHFSDGLFSYLKNEETFGRNNGPGSNGATRGGQSQTSQSALPKFLQNKIGR